MSKNLNRDWTDLIPNSALLRSAELGHQGVSADSYDCDPIALFEIFTPEDIRFFATSFLFPEISDDTALYKASFNSSLPNGIVAHVEGNDGLPEFNNRFLRASFEDLLQAKGQLMPHFKEELLADISEGFRERREKEHLSKEARKIYALHQKSLSKTHEK